MHFYSVTAEDDSIGWILTQTAGLSAGSDFPFGITVNTFVVTDVAGNSASCSFTVTVEDKIKPLCIPPDEVVIPCEQFEPSLMPYGDPTITDNCCIDHLTKFADYSLFDTVCNRGTIMRIFHALDCSGNSSSCAQRVVVNYTQNYFIKFPNDTLVTFCNSTGIYDRPIFYGENCELMTVSYEDEIYTIIIPDACYQIERNWTIINWCTYNPDLPLTYVPNPYPNASHSSPANLPGPTVSACGTAAPWAPTISKINPNDTVATNFCNFWSANANGYHYRQIIKILDTVEHPIILNCPAAPLTFVDSTINDPYYWNNVFSPFLPAQNLGETEIELSIDATDACAQEYVSVQYFLFLDLDGDGVMETVVDCDHPPPAGYVFYNNVQAPNYNGGTLTEIDSRPVPLNQKWRFTLQKTFIGHSVHAAVRWNTTQFPNVYTVPELPLGTHKIKWSVLDACGTESTCEYIFTIQPSPFECIPPANVVVSCEQFDPSLLSYGEPNLVGSCCIDTLIKSANYAQFDSICRRGTITRIFNALDCCGNTSQCSQQIVVNAVQDYYIKFPDDTLTSVCNATGIYGEPIFFGENCELMAVSYEDEIFGLIWPDACVRIDRIWTVINWCTYDPGQPLTNVPNPTLVLTSYHIPLNAPGPIVSACGTPAPWAPTISKINPSDTVETNFCSFWNANANGYRYRQFVKILDTIPPTFLHCAPGDTTFLDPTENHPFYWNNVFNPILPAQNLAERQVDLSIEATDACYGGNINIEYLLFLDLDSDGQQETVVSSINLGLAGLGWNNVQYSNIATPNFTGGTPTSFDARPVPVDQKWGFSIQETIAGNKKSAFVRWNTKQSLNNYVVPELPVGTHKIKWFAQDGCGSERVCEQVFTVKASPLACIPPADVVVSCEQFDPSLLTYGEPTFSGGCVVQDLKKSANYAQFDTVCSKGTVVRIFNAVDDCNNLSQCTQRVVVSYKQDYYIKFPNDMIITDCNGLGNYGAPVFFGEDCELLAVSYDDWSEPGVPDACFKFERTWTVINWCTYNQLLNITNVPNPNPNPQTNNPANLPGPTVSACGTAPPWASTFVKISPTDPAPTDFCTFWSANANGYKYKQLIKIIDGTAPTISNCPAPPSHFEDATQNDPELWQNIFNPNLPVQDLRETPVDLTVTVTDACSGSNVNIEYLLFLDLDANGQQETVVNSVYLGPVWLGWNNVRYNNINTPNFSGGTPTSFDDRAVPANQKWGFAIKENIVGNNKTASVRWNTEQSPNSFVLPELPNGWHKIKWFATDGCGNNKECERIFSIGDTTLVGTHSPEKEGFALYQNEPNPFGSSTAIRFQLPESTPATLSVFDANGRMLFQQTADYGQGMNMVTLEKDQLASPGVLFYKLEAGANVAWRKMVLLR